MIREWERWWASADVQLPDLLPYVHPPVWSGLEAAPALRAFLMLEFEGAETWLREVEESTLQRSTGSLHLTRFVADHEARLGRAVRPFHLRLVQVPVIGAEGWWFSDDVAVVSCGLADDEPALEHFLQPALSRIA